MSIIEPLPSKIWEYLQKGCARFNKLEKTKQKHIILGAIILILGMEIFFNAFFDYTAYAQKTEPSGEIADEVMDPLNKIDRGWVKGVCLPTGQAGVGECEDTAEIKILKEKESKLDEMVGDYPISVMIPHIVKRNQAVASFLVAIAKKESDWGKHTPKKDGKECFNFWGYRGKENTTDSGYSCFDSPEDAIEVVGNRIESLVEKKINTPERMVVWKCGRDCEAAGGQAAANKWISDVAHIYKKLQS